MDLPHPITLIIAVSTGLVCLLVYLTNLHTKRELNKRAERRAKQDKEDPLFFVKLSVLEDITAHELFLANQYNSYWSRMSNGDRRKLFELLPDNVKRHYTIMPSRPRNSTDG